MTRTALTQLKSLAPILAGAVCAIALLGTVTGYAAFSGLDVFAGLAILVMLRADIKSVPEWFGSRVALLLIPATTLFKFLTIYVDLRAMDPLAFLELALIGASAALMVSVNRARSAI